MERINDTIRDREKTFRGLKSFDSPVIKGFQVYYNYMRKHEAINKTPAEQALIRVDGKSKWITLIQNASLYRISE